MELTEIQQDALVELLNIGFGRAGASLSQLTGQRVLLEVPGRRHPSRSPQLDAVAEEGRRRERRERAPDLLRPGRAAMRC